MNKEIIANDVAQEKGNKSEKITPTFLNNEELMKVKNNPYGNSAEFLFKL